jgi:hypothetical protein
MYIYIIQPFIIVQTLKYITVHSLPHLIAGSHCHHSLEDVLLTHLSLKRFIVSVVDGDSLQAIMVIIRTLKIQ